MKTYVIAAQHGEELFGLKVIAALSHKSSQTLLLRVGNPEAIAKRKRYIDTDLNRSYMQDELSKEARLAANIKTEIEQFKPDCIIDIHTSRTEMQPVAIAAQYSDKIERFAQALGMEAIVVMPLQFAKHSLIGCFPDRSVSIEFGKKHRSDRLAINTALLIEKLELSRPTIKTQLPRYEVTTTIPKNHTGLRGIVNLAYNPKLKAYPFLASESSYETNGGFAANRVN